MKILFDRRHDLGIGHQASEADGIVKMDEGHSSGSRALRPSTEPP
jgi:hypothetical protein